MVEQQFKVICYKVNYENSFSNIEKVPGISSLTYTYYSLTTCLTFNFRIAAYNSNQMKHY